MFFYHAKNPASPYIIRSRGIFRMLMEAKYNQILIAAYPKALFSPFTKNNGFFVDF